jgi:hypothetical protein
MLAHFHFTYKENILQLPSIKSKTRLNLGQIWSKFVTFNLCECYFLLYLQNLHLRKCHFWKYFNSLKLTHELSSLIFFTQNQPFCGKVHFCFAFIPDHLLVLLIWSFFLQKNKANFLVYLMMLFSFNPLAD